MIKIDENDIFQKDVIGNVRTAQEDSHDLARQTPNGDLFVVCDGMGGHVGGKQASSIAVNSIMEYLGRERYSDPLTAMDEALQFANMQILGCANEYPELKGMGTTACIVLVQDTEVYIAHVGDSRIYLYLGKEKRLHRITKDHSFVQTLVDAGQITDEEAEHHPHKNRILKALGIKPELSPSFNTVKPKAGDVFMICSDGLSGMVTDSEMCNVMSRNLALAGKGDALIDMALEAGGVDNITLELVRISSSQYEKSVFQDFNPGKADESEKAQKDDGTLSDIKRIRIFSLSVCVIVAIIAAAFLGYCYIQPHVWKKQLAGLEKQEIEIARNLAVLNNELKELKQDLAKSKENFLEQEKSENPDKFHPSIELSKEAYQKREEAIKVKEELQKQKVDSLSTIRESIRKIKRKLNNRKHENTSNRQDS
ncbi:MAG: Stp1/IreP family PP2C-type Ser/Thr phosphatase [Clostridium sp.]|nr:Stp1/IreP family PP2C-type Ser/Thr phosphatase [Bacteroides sp.]MCM1198483.1 Stp1/IreP family PP2C-type Ser/Thr phosphatase [Clostridium sp.]